MFITGSDCSNNISTTAGIVTKNVWNRSELWPPQREALRSPWLWL